MVNMLNDADVMLGPVGDILWIRSGTPPRPIGT
ncbi:unnamed protein product, partial [marine sediment metagenome]